MRKVFIVGGNYQYLSLFQTEGYVVVDEVWKADLVCFTGGEDVSPTLYGEPTHKTTWPNLGRDNAEKSVYRECILSKIPMVGICRGGQFLNVMCGGRMYQDVSGHAIMGLHTIYDLLDGDEVQVTSTHHQMMRPSSRALVIAVAREGSKKVAYSHEDAKFYIEDGGDEYEVVCYEEEGVLCFQPHPEYTGVAYQGMKEYFFRCINQYLF